jgi:hypothetical protein
VAQELIADDLLVAVVDGLTSDVVAALGTFLRRHGLHRDVLPPDSSACGR